MTVDYNPDLVSEKEIEKAVADAGYSASVLIRQRQRVNQSAKVKPHRICGISFFYQLYLRYRSSIFLWEVWWGFGYQKSLACQLTH